MYLWKLSYTLDNEIICQQLVTAQMLYLTKQKNIGKLQSFAIMEGRKRTQKPPPLYWTTCEKL